MFPQRTLADPLPGSVVTDYITVTAAHRHMYWAVPPAQLHDVVAAHVNLGARLIPSVPEAARRSLAAAISESSLLAGRIEFFDLQNPATGTGQPGHRAASRARRPRPPARLGRTRPHGIHPGILRRRETRRRSARQDPGSAAFARRGPASPEMLAWLDAVEAEVETRFGNTRKALQLIHHAEDIFATEEPRPSPPWLDWFSPVRLAGFKGNTLLIARQPGPARDTLQRRPGSPARRIGKAALGHPR